MTLDQNAEILDVDILNISKDNGIGIVSHFLNVFLALLAWKSLI